MKSTEEANDLSLQLGCIIVVDDIFCNACRLAIIRNDGSVKQRIKKINTSTDESNVTTQAVSPILFAESDSHLVEVSSPVQNYNEDEKRRSSRPEFFGCSSQPYSELSSTSSQQLSSYCTSQDPLYEPPQKQVKEEDEEYIFLPFHRTVATHICCFICLKTEDLKVIPLQARLQLFISRRIYIPRNDRCCSSHLIKTNFIVMNWNI